MRPQRGAFFEIPRARSRPTSTCKSRFLATQYAHIAGRDHQHVSHRNERSLGRRHAAEHAEVDKQHGRRDDPLRAQSGWEIRLCSLESHARARPRPAAVRGPTSAKCTQDVSRPATALHAMRRYANAAQDVTTICESARTQVARTARTVPGAHHDEGIRAGASGVRFLVRDQGTRLICQCEIVVTSAA